MFMFAPPSVLALSLLAFEEGRRRRRSSGLEGGGGSADFSPAASSSARGWVSLLSDGRRSSLLEALNTAMDQPGLLLPVRPINPLFFLTVRSNPIAESLSMRAMVKPLCFVITLRCS